MTNLHDMSCVHHYIIDQSNNAECKHCGEARTFHRNPIKYNNVSTWPTDYINRQNRVEFMSVKEFDTELT